MSAGISILLETVANVEDSQHRRADTSPKPENTDLNTDLIGQAAQDIYPNLGEKNTTSPSSVHLERAALKDKGTQGVRGRCGEALDRGNYRLTKQIVKLGPRKRTKMTMARLPEISTLPSLPTQERAEVLDLLFEPSQPLHTLSVELLREQTFPSYDELTVAVGVQLTELSESASSSDTKWLESILGSHPRLGAKEVDSAQSQAEQAQLQAGGEEEAEKLRSLNEEYEETFPGLRYVVFVNGRSRPVIMEDMRKRIAAGDIKAERAAAIRVSLNKKPDMHSANHVRRCVRLLLTAPLNRHEQSRIC